MRKGLDRVLQAVYIVGRCAYGWAVNAPQDCGYDQYTYDEQRSTPLTLHFALAFLPHGA
jgi:hypothetical protein